MYESDMQSEVTGKILDPSQDPEPHTSSYLIEDGKLVGINYQGHKAAYTAEEARRLANEIEGDMGAESLAEDIRETAHKVDQKYE